MSRKIKQAFESDGAVIPLSRLMPLKVVSDGVKRSSKYRVIATSVAEVGIIEPLIVARSKDHAEKYLLLDGHMRYTALTDLGLVDVQCLISDDDEAYTYNKRISRLATIQEHYMIVRAIERGVSEEKLARALNLDVRAIKRRRNLLSGICPEVVELLKDKAVNPTAFDVLRKMKPMRQIDAAELMNTVGTYTASYAKALLAATRQNDLVKSTEPKRVVGMTSEQMSRMEREMEKVQRDLKGVEARYGEDVLQLVIASGYLTKLIGNAGVKRYLTRNHPEILTEFQAIVSSASLE